MRGAAERRDAPGSATGPGLGSAVVGVLTGLLQEERALRDAVIRHDRTALTGSIERSEAFLGELEGLLPQTAKAFGDGGLGRAEATRIVRLRDQLRTTARQNAVLIERAWRFDAAAMRLLARVAQGLGEAGAPGSYAPVPVSTYLDRRA